MNLFIKNIHRISRSCLIPSYFNPTTLIKIAVNPFRLKPMNSQIKVCQGCRGPLHLSSGTVTNAPFDFCVVIKERWSYKDPKTGQLCTAAHYHLRIACVQTEELSFLPCTLVISEGLQLTECHKNYVIKEFGVIAC